MKQETIEGRIETEEREREGVNAMIRNSGYIFSLLIINNSFI